jgi:hypothetical protein
VQWLNLLSRGVRCEDSSAEKRKTAINMTSTSKIEQIAVFFVPTAKRAEKLQQ